MGAENSGTTGDDRRHYFSEWREQYGQWEGIGRLKNREEELCQNFSLTYFFEQCQDFIATSTIASGKYMFKGLSFCECVLSTPILRKLNLCSLLEIKPVCFGVGDSLQAEVQCDEFCSQV